MEPIGRRRWGIAEADIPSQSSHCALPCHETAHILNAGDPDARGRVMVFFVDPAGPCDVTVTARRTLHLRCNDLKNPAPTPCNTDYASVSNPMSRSCCNTRGSIHVTPSVKPVFNNGLCTDVTADCRTVPAGTQSN